MAFIIGALGGALIVAAFVAGVLVSDRLRKTTPQPFVTIQTEGEDGETAEQIKKKRRDLQATQDAFHQLQNYNADMAYGVSRSEDDRLTGE